MKPSFILSSSIRLDRLFQAYRKNPALIMPSATLTFGDIRENLRTVIFNLNKAGVRKGDHVALHAENGELHLYLFLASWMMGFLYFPLDVKAPLKRLRRDINITYLVTDAEVPAAMQRSALLPEDIMQGLLPFPEKIKWPAIPFKREASVIFTSGSTGKPQGLVHTVGNYIYSALGTNEFIGLEPSDRWLLSLPLFHVGGVLIWVRTLLSGSACILPDTLKGIDIAVRTHRPSILSLVPTQLIRLLESGEIVTILQHAKTIMLGGAPSPAWLIEKALDMGIPIMPTYGCTESCAQVTGVAKGANRQAHHTAGHPVPYREVRIDEDGAIMLGGKTIFKRYLHDRKSGSAREDGFFKTADAGFIDDDGNLVILGRNDGVFISGGENIHPFEIENNLLAMDHIAAAIVVPVPHREFGMSPWVFVETSAPIDEAKLMAGLRACLPGYKIPKRIIRLDPGEKKGKLKYSRDDLAGLAREMAEDEGKGGK